MNLQKIPPFTPTFVMLERNKFSKPSPFSMLKSKTFAENLMIKKLAFL
jgi:hypothetical protein